MRANSATRFLIFFATALVLTAPNTGCVKAPDGETTPSATERQSATTAQAAPAAAPQTTAPAPTEVARYSGPIAFTDVTAKAGINFTHNSGAFGKKYLPETVGSGCAFLDYDNDGWQDILLINSTNWPGHKGKKSVPALYHNNRNGSFSDVTADAGLAVEIYGIGCAAADYDNDGNIDLYITCLGSNHLFRNLGTGKFVDVTAKAGVEDAGFSTSAAWVDYDKDGKLDLFVCHYVEWSIEKDLFCTLDGKNKSYCTPESYKGQSSTLFKNRGDGSFENVTERAGLRDATGKSLGVTLIDFDGDGWMDLFVANDTQPNKLYRNKGDGSFTDVAMSAGVAFNDQGVARAGMGVDAADYDGSGRPSLIIGNFSNEMMALYHNEGNGLFIDEAPTSTIGQASLLTLSFACFFFDYDLDSLPDIFAANGHVADDINAVQPKIKYAEPPHLFRNLGKKQFEEITGKLGPALQRPIVARGAVYGDFDNDGDLDILMALNNGPARLLRNDGGNQNNLVRIRTIGTASNRDGIGAKITVKSATGASTWSIVKTGSSYCSQSELPLTFGLGRAEKVTSIEVIWPNGRKDVSGEVAANQVITIQEGKGITATQPIVLAGP
ncbi:MAG TPA: CRTAC1 family protein [Blastocatellia bacterium]|nr:CRTAC1 family protein [Blastocatellia bacterium]